MGTSLIRVPAVGRDILGQPEPERVVLSKITRQPCPCPPVLVARAASSRSRRGSDLTNIWSQICLSDVTTFHRFRRLRAAPTPQLKVTALTQFVTRIKLPQYI